MIDVYSSSNTANAGIEQNNCTFPPNLLYALL